MEKLVAVILLIFSSTTYAASEPPSITAPEEAQIVELEQETEVTETKAETVTAPLQENIVITNPNGCNHDKQWIMPDGTCKDKKVETSTTPPKAVTKYKTSGGCEQYRSLLQQYDWDVEIAMLAMQKESSCRAEAVSPRNRNGTRDYGLFQLNNQKVLDPAQNIAIAYKKYKAGRVGENNWSAWYAICSPGNNPQPKYPNVKCR